MASKLPDKAFDLIKKMPRVALNSVRMLPGEEYCMKSVSAVANFYELSCKNACWQCLCPHTHSHKVTGTLNSVALD